MYRHRRRGGKKKGVVIERDRDLGSAVRDPAAYRDK
jgi:hypothetical protein